MPMLALNAWKPLVERPVCIVYSSFESAATRSGAVENLIFIRACSSSINFAIKVQVVLLLENVFASFSFESSHHYPESNH